jgi:hypothetical protein
MTALVADTFYWIALADFADSTHQRALTLTAELASSRIVTTDEVLAEYLTFFSTAPEPLRREVAQSVEGILASSVIHVIPQSRESFLAGLQLYRARPRQGIQPGRLYFHAGDAHGRADRGPHKRPALEQEGFPSPVSGLLRTVG